MPRFELSIDAAYLEGSWGAFQGMRELVQNARDAEVEFNAPMEITHYFNEKTGNGQLRINNDGAQLSRSAMLMGNTSKADRDDLIGKWGEGLKVGILALLRDGYEVKIRTGSEVWIPSIGRSEKFDAEVLIFDVMTGRKNQDRVRVEVSPFSKGDWKAWRKKFLFLDEEEKDTRIPTYYGTLLLEPEHKGWIFVKGIATEHVPEFGYGYDLKFADLDRDRKMVNRWQLKYYTTQLWQSAMAKRPDLLDPLFSLLQEEKEEGQGFAENLSPEIKEKVAEKFTETFGEKALPVASIGDSAKLEHHGRKGIVAPRPMREILDSVFGTTAENLTQMEQEAQKQYSWHELSDIERANLQRAVEMISKEEPRLDLDLVKVTDFCEEAVQGTYEVKDGERVISLAKKILEDRATTLKVVLHEAAHMDGSDGEHSHVQRIENMWSNILERVLSN
ncbi:MAG: hypothetical protein GF334_10385 [Candidatus Altiarchaeales archaeon]|nr:hypothetical protein [Candidatus Altiarchaeales archaeon]